MFRYRSFKNIGYNNSETPAVYSYETTEDTIAKVSVSGYFSDPRAEIREGDLIIARCTDGSTSLTALSSDSVVAMPAAADVAGAISTPALLSQTEPSAKSSGMAAAIYPSVATLDGMYVLTPCVTGDKTVEQLYGKGTGTPENATNVGGSPNHRPTTARVIATIVGNLNPFAQSGTITNSNTLGNTTWDVAAGRPASGINSASPQRYKNGTLGFGDRPLFKLSSGATIEYYAKGESLINFYCSGTLSSSVTIDTDTAVSGTYNNSENISLVGQSGAYNYTTAATLSKVRITNNTANACWVMGVNISNLNAADETNVYDSLVSWRYQHDIGAGTEDMLWIGSSEGSNTVALKDDGGMFFGDWHAGHSLESVSLTVTKFRQDVVIKEAADIVAGTFDYGSSITTESQSKVTSGIPHTYNCNIKVRFFAGGNRVIGNIDAGEQVNIIEAYTGMTIANKRFNQLTAPIVADLSGTPVGTITLLGSSNTATQLDPVENQSIKTTTTMFSDEYSERDGAWIDTRVDDYKFYYNPMYQLGGFTDKIEFETEHLFYS
jgi:hypothetical protein